MRVSRLVFVVCILGVSVAAGPPDAARAGSAGAGATVGPRKEVEEKFRAIPSPEKMREYMKRLSARPHHVGSPYDKDNAEWLLERFREWGWDAHIEVFEVLFPTPRERLVELVEPTHFTAKLEEPALPVDPTSAQKDEQLPTYNAYSIDGDVTAPLVYVNYGIPEDYERLERLGISVKGAIVIARYGHSWRGIKPKVAAEHGAVGCLIFSDPRDDGYFAGDVFPAGAWRPPDGAQRGSVMDMPVSPGDPLTPDVGATQNAKRLELKDVKTLTKIPVMPMSYADAQPLLRALGGAVAPEAWRGALGITYHVGPGPARVHLKVKFNWDRKPLYDVIAKIPGAAYPDEWIIRGNHHDAWVNGAQDPVSGLVPELEEARALGELFKAGWRPKRTIIYCAWDGEEPGLLGSTEWTEEHAEELRKHAVVYINSDTNSRGYLQAGGSHTLEKMMNDVARDIRDPETSLAVWKRLQLRRIARARTREERQELRQRADLRIEALGSGSDYTPFLQFLGVATLNLGYGGESGGGIYHSIYDDFYWYTHFDDPEFVYGRALAQTAGTTVIRFAEAEELPFDFAGLADAVRKYVGELERLASDQRDAIRERNWQIEEGVFRATADPKETFVPPTREDEPPHLNFAPLLNSVDALSRSAERYRRIIARAEEKGTLSLAPETLRALNRELLRSERVLTSPEGLPGRPWFKHQIYAPGFYTGYSVKTIPAVREAIEQKQWKEADAAVLRVAKILEGEAALIDRASDMLEKVKP